VRICLIAPVIPDYCIEFAETIAESADVLLCIADKHFSPDRSMPTPRLEIQWLRWPRQRDVIGSTIFMTRLARRVRQWRPDIVHILAEGYVWTNLLPSLLRSSPIVTTVHDIRLHPGDVSSSRIPRFFIKSLVRQSDAIIVHGEGLRRDAASQLPIELERIFVFPHPPLLRYRNVAQKHGFTKPSDGLFRVLFFGRIYEYKGLRYLLQAAPMIKAVVGQLKIIVAGTGDDFEKYRNLVSDPTSVQMHDEFIPVDQAARLFTEADVLALPYIEASQSGVLMIAMPFGLPVVATDVGEIAETIKSTGTGLLVPTRDEAALAKALIKIASDKDLRNRLSSKAKAAMDGPYSRKALSKRALAIYGQVLKVIELR
jgi:glycosyltransferase involved in cell wall biosynthesis